MRRLLTFGGLAIVDDDDPAWRAAVQRRQLLLLAVLARTGPIGLTRDKALALLWPERDEPAARHLLDQALYAARRALGRDALPPGPALRLAPGGVACDALAFDAALKSGDGAGALALYRGPFLDGVHVTDAPELARWIDEERGVLARRAHAAAVRLADATTADAAVEWWRAAAALDPLDAATAVGLVRALAAGGDVAGALRQGDVHQRLVRDTLDLPCAPELAALLARLRAGEGVGVVPGVPGELPVAPVASALSVESVPVHAPPPTSGASDASDAFDASGDGASPRRLWPGADGDPVAAAPPPAAARVDGGPRRRRRRAASAVFAALAVFGLSRFGGDTAAARDHAAAQRLGDEALATRYAGDDQGAARLFRAALATDSLDPWLWYQLAVADFGSELPPGAWQAPMRRARTLVAARGPERLRRLIEARDAFQRGDTGRVALAGRYAARYPDDAEGAMLYGASLDLDAQPVAAVAPLRRAIALDAAAIDRGLAGTPGAQAYLYLSWALSEADSVAAVTAMAREWSARQPRSPFALLSLAYSLVLAGRAEDALAVARDATARGLETDPWRAAFSPLVLTELLLAADRCGEADALVTPLTRVGTPKEQFDALWYRVIVLRYQRRYAEALAAARQLRALTPVAHPEGAYEFMGYEAQVLLESGRPRAAAALYDSAAAAAVADTTIPAGTRARRATWTATHAAGALAAAGDTADLARRADALETRGRLSAMGRDRRLHHYVRGLLWAARGEHARAVAEYEQAVLAPAVGYTRINLALARSFLALGRADSAIYWLRAAARGGIVANNYYVTRADAYAALAAAYRRAGRPDSARAYEARVRRATGGRG